MDAFIYSFDNYLSSISYAPNTVINAKYTAGNIVLCGQELVLFLGYVSDDNGTPPSNSNLIQVFVIKPID